MAAEATSPQAVRNLPALLHRLRGSGFARRRLTRLLPFLRIEATVAVAVEAGQQVGRPLFPLAQPLPQPLGLRALVIEFAEGVEFA